MALPRARSTLSDRIAQDLASRIESGEFGSGDRLPTESALAAQYDSGRSAVREAVARLRRDGIVITRQGAGAFVAASGGNAFRLEGKSGAEALHALFELRAAVEGDAAALAATRAGPDALARMTEAYEHLKDETRAGADGHTADLAFHLSVARASGNELFLRLLHLLDGQILEQIAIARSNSALSEGLPDQVLAEHEAILTAVASGDSKAAREASLSHLRSACARLKCGAIGL